MTPYCIIWNTKQLKGFGLNRNYNLIMEYSELDSLKAEWVVNEDHTQTLFFEINVDSIPSWAYEFAFSNDKSGNKINKDWMAIWINKPNYKLLTYFSDDVDFSEVEAFLNDIGHRTKTFGSSTFRVRVLEDKCEDIIKILKNKFNIEPIQIGDQV